MKRTNEATTLGSCLSNKRTNSPSGCVQPLVLLLSDISPQVRRRATHKLLNLSEKNTNHKQIIGAGALGPLVAMLSDQDHEAVELAAEILGNLSTSGYLHQKLADGNAILPLVILLGTGSLSSRISAVFAINQLVSADNEEIANIAPKLGAVKYLVRLLDREDGDLSCQRFASHALFNISAGEGNYGGQMLAHGLVEKVIPMLMADADSECNENAAGIIHNLTMDETLKSRIIQDARLSFRIGTLSDSLASILGTLD